jgi:spheroidene monooxygenase|tara:strand:- start:1106 stop:1813 length:708 start_codon:yes stop_codon:yes gene_type:complete
LKQNKQIVAISFFRFEGVFQKLWAFSQMGFARKKLKKIKQISFFKLFGSGIGEGFTPYPNTSVYAILSVWNNLGEAENNIEEREIYENYRTHSIENWTVFLSPISSKGYWDKTNPFKPNKNEFKKKDHMLAALTRATIKPKIMLKFWSKVPAISKVIGNDKNVLFKMGLGEIPWFHQVTFSIWPNAKTMADFARKDGPHAKAIKSVREGNWFSEELYARFEVKKAIGKWCGKSVI